MTTNPTFIQSKNVDMPVNQRDLQSLWVLPYVWELYQYISDQMNFYDLTVQQVKSLSIGTYLENLRKQVDYSTYEYYYKSWVKIRIGITSYFEENAMAPLDDSCCIYDIISVCHSNEIRFGLLVDTMKGIIKRYQEQISNSPGRQTILLNNHNQLVNLDEFIGFSSIDIDDSIYSIDDYESEF